MYVTDIWKYVIKVEFPKDKSENELCVNLKNTEEVRNIISKIAENRLIDNSGYDLGIEDILFDCHLDDILIFERYDGNPSLIKLPMSYMHDQQSYVHGIIKNLKKGE